MNLYVSPFILSLQARIQVLILVLCPIVESTFVSLLPNHHLFYTTTVCTTTHSRFTTNKSSVSRRNHHNHVKIYTYLQPKKQILEPHHVPEILQTIQQNHHQQQPQKLDGFDTTLTPSDYYYYYNFKDDNEKNLLPVFNDFVTTIASTSCIPRKELYEAWSCALIIHFQFRHIRRIADLACGHGLLSWALLLLDLYLYNDKQPTITDDDNNNPTTTSTNNDDEPYYYNEHGNHTTTYIPRSAICIDKRMPQSAEKVANAMLSKWPHLSSYWNYVETKLDNIIPSPDTLLCGIHACGILSDQIISFAIQANAPLAILPCCHSKKSLRMMDIHNNTFQVNNNYINHHGDNDNNSNDNAMTLSQRVDYLRIERLQSAGYHVLQTQIPKEYTPQNNLILASPSPLIYPDTTNNGSNCDTYHSYTNHDTKTTSKNIDHHRPHYPNTKQNITNPNKSFHKYPQSISVPLGNDPTSLRIVSSLSGKDAANQRKQPKSTSLCVSIYMQPNHLITPNCILLVCHDIWRKQQQHDNSKSTMTHNRVVVDIEYADDEYYIHPISKLYARTFRITYITDGYGSFIKKTEAKRLHGILCDGLSSYLHGVTVRR